MLLFLSGKCLIVFPQEKQLDHLAGEWLVLSGTAYPIHTVWTPLHPRQGTGGAAPPHPHQHAPSWGRLSTAGIPVAVCSALSPWLFKNYILLIVLLKLSQFFPLCHSNPAAPTPTGNPHTSVLVHGSCI